MNKKVRVVSLVTMLASLPVVSQAAFNVDVRLFNEYQTRRHVADEPVEVRPSPMRANDEYERLQQLKAEVEALLKQLDQARAQVPACAAVRQEVQVERSEIPVASTLPPSVPVSRAVSNKRIKWSVDPMRRRAFNHKVALRAGFYFWDEFFSRVLPSGYVAQGFLKQTHVAGVYVDEKSAVKSRSDWLAVASEQAQIEVHVGRKKVVVSQPVDSAKK